MPKPDGGSCKCDRSHELSISWGYRAYSQLSLRQFPRLPALRLSSAWSIYKQDRKDCSRSSPAPRLGLEIGPEHEPFSLRSSSEFGPLAVGFEIRRASTPCTAGRARLG